MLNGSPGLDSLGCPVEAPQAAAQVFFSVYKWIPDLADDQNQLGVGVGVGVQKATSWAPSWLILTQSFGMELWIPVGLCFKTPRVEVGSQCLARVGTIGVKAK